MKKLFSIVFAAVIVLSGMHISLATHVCGGELAAVKWSLSEEKASCGMQMPKPIHSTVPTISDENCCKDEISDFAVDHTYNPSTLQVNEPMFHLLQVFLIPENTGSLAIATSFSPNTNVQPPGNYIASAVSLPDICVFLI
jgi:hypothetical protein